jgi:hypothetical protein
VLGYLFCIRSVEVISSETRVCLILDGAVAAAGCDSTDSIIQTRISLSVHSPNSYVQMYFSILSYNKKISERENMYMHCSSNKTPHYNPYCVL